MGPGVVTYNGVMVTVTRMCTGGQITPAQCRDKEAVIAVGRFLSEFHQAGKEFIEFYPELAAELGDSHIKTQMEEEAKQLEQEEASTKESSDASDKKEPAELNTEEAKQDMHVSQFPP